MKFELYHEKMKAFYEKLQDEESKKLFDARFLFFISRNANDLEESICKEISSDINFRCGWINDYFKKNPEMIGKPFLIFGAADRAKCTVRTLQLMKYEIAGIVDNNSKICGTKLMDKFVIEEPSVIPEKYMDCIIFVAVQKKYQIDIFHQIMSYGVDARHIFMNTEGSLFAAYGKQYFDLQEMTADKKGEVFVDAGCYDGLTDVDFKAWAGNYAKKVIAFEPDSKNLEKCKKRLDTIGLEYEIHNIATWGEKTVLRFNMNEEAGYASKVAGFGNVEVKADSIDNVLNGEEVTFIKLDVEGAELKTLQGAIKTIKKCRPKLAISIYHKPEDIVEIPMFLEKLNLDYKYYIRHYQTRRCETVLYAI